MNLLPLSLMMASTLAQSAPVQAAQIGAAAPAFVLTDSSGKTHQLADYATKTVVLEWTNAECPFVKKHYGAGNMQAQQRRTVEAGVVWLTVNSSAPGKQGHVDPQQAQQIMAATAAAQSAYLLDASGAVGRAYGAKTTPHLFIIDGTGTLRYNGAIDSIASADTNDIPKATQYVEQALAELRAGRAISVPVSQPYGCSVKY